MTRCSKRSNTIRDSGTTLGPNVLLRRMVYELKKCPNVVPFISGIIQEFYGHQRRLPNTEFTQYPVKHVLEALQKNGADLTTQLSSGNNDQSRTSTFNRSDARPSQYGRGDDNARRTGFAGRGSDRAQRTNYTGRGDSAGQQQRPRFGRPNVNNIKIDDQEFDIDEALDQQEESYKVDAVKDAPVEDADDADVQEEFIAFCQEHEPFVNTINAIEDRCSICEQKHQTLNCYLLTQENIPVLIQRRITQAQV